VNIDYLGQLISASEKALLVLEKSIKQGDKRKIQEAKVFLFSIYKQINKILSEENKK
jgi:hypothetical protein